MMKLADLKKLRNWRKLMKYSNNNGFIVLMGDSDRNKAITIAIFCCTEEFGEE